MGPRVRPGGVTNDASIPSKRMGFLNHCPAKFCFIGPDRAPVTVNSIEKCLKIANIIRKTRVPNYAQARIPLASGLNIAEWELELQDYPDQMLIQYLEFGFPLSLMDSSQLCNTSIKNHHSANQFPTSIKEYRSKEIAIGAILGPEYSVDSEHFHCSPLLTRPKDKDKRQVILNLSHPYG